MIVLGVADNHDSGAAVTIDGVLVSAVNQERVDRVKSSGAFPWGAIDAALATAGVSEREVDRIAFGTAFTPSLALRALPTLHQDARAGGQFSPLLHAYVVYQSLLKGTGLHTVEVDACKAILRHRLKDRPFGAAALQLLDHHRSHAHGAYRSQPRERCLVLTVDAMGDGTTATVSLGTNGQLDHIARQSGLASVNNFYSRVTERLGFTPNRHEGKVTGLAAFVPPPPRLVDHLKTRVRFSEGRFLRGAVLHTERKDDPYWAELERWSREEVASAAQAVLEEAVLAFVRFWVQKTGCADVAVAGGVFANVKLNQRIAQADEVDSLWVFPHMGDGGLAVGAAMDSAGTAPHRLVTAALGPEASDRDCYKALKRADLPQDNLRERGPVGGLAGDVARAAELLAAGRVVARCDGRLEWGPRALGNRSIFARPNDPTINQWLNERLRRSEFMPFAPMVREEEASGYFSGLDKAPEAARFMTVCFEASAELRRVAPAAVHVDGTARPQVVRRQDDPTLHALLTRVGELTGAPVLINTSFNLHEEPIVHTPSDAVRAFQQGRLDALWLGGYIAERASA
jgi:carbamoyltransferase